MAGGDVLSDDFTEKEHQAAYIFDPEGHSESPKRPSKRRKVSRKHNEVGRSNWSSSVFQPLLNGEEPEDCVKLRHKLFEESWCRIDQRIHHVLRDANRSTLEDVTAFVQESCLADVPCHGRIPSAFIIGGANIASQHLLFEQLVERLEENSQSRVVNLGSADASNLKAALKKIIHHITTKAAKDDDDQEISVVKGGRKYLNYDLEALSAFLKTNPLDHVVIAFRDSEAFDGGLLSDLVLLFSSWLDRIPFTLLFGIATSVELFQARLPKSTCRLLHGEQFDVEQTEAVVDRIFKTAVAHADAPLRLGPSLLSSLLERQRDQVAGIPLLVSSLRYAYMCHFYGNPLSVLLSKQVDSHVLHKQHLQALRAHVSFRSMVEKCLDEGALDHVRALLLDDRQFIGHLKKSTDQVHQWVISLLRILKMMQAMPSGSADFSQLYLDALSHGVDVANHNSDFLVAIKRMGPAEAISYLSNVLDAVNAGDHTLGLPGWAGEDVETVELLSTISADIQQLQNEAEANHVTLKSKYNSRSRVARTTVVAQRVQMSYDDAALTDRDKAYTDLMDRLVTHLGTVLKICKAEDLYLHEVYMYRSDIPHKHVFIPRPREVVEGALLQPHNYLQSISSNDQVLATLPATAIVYQLYLETGSLINVADLWSAYFAIVGKDNEAGLDERTALVLFYRALSDLRALGFVKQSRRKADHIAKIAWRGL